VRSEPPAIVWRVSGAQSIHNVRVQTPSRVVSLPWKSAQDFVARCIAAYPTTHPVVERFRARGVSRPVELTDPNDCTFALAVIEAWNAQAGEADLSPGIRELRDALRDDAS
jgi:hypothetical protein